MLKATRLDGLQLFERQKLIIRHHNEQKNISETLCAFAICTEGRKGKSFSANGWFRFSNNVSRKKSIAQYKTKQGDSR
jgi:hypothetical protein